MMDCKVACRKIDEATSGRLLAEDVRGHLETCSRCAAFQSGRLALGDLLQSLSPVSAPPDFYARLEKRLYGAGTFGRRRTWFAPGTLSVPSWTVAAALVLILSLGVVYREARFRYKNGNSAVAIVTRSIADTEGTTRPTFEPSLVQSDGGFERSAKGTEPIQKINRPGEAIAVTRRTEVLNSRRSIGETGPNSLRVGTFKANTIEASVRPAQVLRFEPGTADNRGPTMLVPLASQGSAVQVMLAGRDGSMRAVSLKAVTFGAQDIIQPVAMERSSAEKGIW